MKKISLKQKSSFINKLKIKKVIKKNYAIINQIKNSQCKFNSKFHKVRTV